MNPEKFDLISTKSLQRKKEPITQTGKTTHSWSALSDYPKASIKKVATEFVR
jgi:hypothetical protein